MSHRCPAPASSCLMAIAVALCLSATVSSAQETEDAAGDWTLQRTADGQPDLQGVWDFRTLTPLQRPSSQDEK